MKTLKIFTVSALIIFAFCFGKSINNPTTLPEKHPEMMAAKKHLEEAKAELKKAAHDYAGHRVKAIELTDGAIKEIMDGIASEK
ncbi:MAG: hypothetical protein ACXVPU_06800 [Bacteroidia bacterium]